MNRDYSAFVLMPFSEEHKNTYELAIKPACRASKVSCHRLDDSDMTVNLIDKMHAELNVADIIIADLSGLNPNVMYEVGYAFGINKQIVLITDEVDTLPFNLSYVNSIVFKKNDLKGLKDKLSAVLRKYLEKSETAVTNISPNPGEEPLPLTSWSKWGGLTVFSDLNTILLQGTVGAAGYVCDRLDRKLAGKSLILYISNTEASKFSMNRLIKVTVNQDDLLLKPKTNLYLIANEYVPAADSKIEYTIPNDFDGKIGFVFYEAELNLLKISAFVK